MYKIGIVGAGAIGAAHKKAIVNNEKCELVAVCDTVEERAVKLAEGTDARTYADYQIMHQKEQLDAVILNLPHYLHKDVTIYFLENGVNVLVEKPMALNVAECDAMIETAIRNNTKLAVGHVQRYYVCYKLLKKVIQEGKLGKLCAITEIRNIDYFTDRPAWFLDRKSAGGGIVMNYGAHTLDKIFYVTGLKVEQVTAVGNNLLSDDTVEATAQLLVKLEGGVAATFCYCGCKVPSYYQTDFYFTNGVAQVRNGNELWISEGKSGYRMVDGQKPHKKLMEAQLEEFIKFLDDEETEVASAEYGREVIEILEKAFGQIWSEKSWQSANTI